MNAPVKLSPKLEADLRSSLGESGSSPVQTPCNPARNLLLRSLSPEDYAFLEPHLHCLTLCHRMALAEADAPISKVYFMEGGVASVVARGKDGVELEVGMVGHEGVTPVAAILGAGSSPHDAYVQIDGSKALVISAAVLRDVMRANQSLRETLHRYAMAFLTQATNTVISNANHPVEQRLARWLLMCRDRLEADEIGITHDVVANLLGIRRASVTVSLHVLEGIGAIRSTRGLVTVLDRALLMELAGEAYGQAEAEYRKLVGPFPATA